MKNMSEQHSNTVPVDSAYVAHLWEYPDLTLAMFGLQVHEEAAGAAYFEAGIEEQVLESLRQEPGVLCVRDFPEGNGGVQLQYWRSHEELADFSKRMPHMAWWKWLIEHDGQGLSFYHEIYRCKTAEAVFEKGMPPIGPGSFCTTSSTELGGNRSVERQQRFLDAQSQLWGQT